jgi:hypothetical protein
MGKIATIFELPDMTHREYDAIMQELEAQGKSYTEKRPSHLAFNKDGKWCVVDVWESEQALNEFVGGTLAPIFIKLGIPTPQPAVYAVHNYLGARAEDLVSA